MKLSHIALMMAILPVAAFAKTDESLYKKSDTIKGYIGVNTHYLRTQLNDVFRDVETFNKFGFDTDINKLINPNHFGLSLNAGAQFNKYFGTEVFLQRIFSSTADETKTNTTTRIHYKSKTSAWTFGADLMGYVPITDTKFSFIGSLGFGYYKFKFDSEYNIIINFGQFGRLKDHKESNIAFRIGFGGQYAFSERWALRGIVRYAALNYDNNTEIVKGLVDISLGARYTF